jgi:hypothetical protein
VFVTAVVAFFLVFFFHGFNQKFYISGDNLKNGDLILRRGRSVESFTVFLLDKNRDFSHVGLIVRENNVPYVIHIVPGKPGYVLKERTPEFLKQSKASHYAVYRPVFGTHQLDKVAAQALIFFQDHRVFDNNYDMETDSALYCTELVIKAFRNANIPLNDILPQELHLFNGCYNVFLPGNLLKSSDFTCLLTE